MANLQAHTKREDYELIVIENGSRVRIANEKGELGASWLEQYADKYIFRPEAMGYARAVNLGLALAEGEYLVILNNDLLLPAGWLDKMIEDYNSVGQTGTLAPLGYPYPAGVGANTGLHYDRHWFSCVLMSRHVFTKVGYLDEQLNYRFHDQDYSIRVVKAGFNVVIDSNIEVQHVNSATYNKMKRNEDPEERERMINRHGFALFEDWVKNENLGRM